MQKTWMKAIGLWIGIMLVGLLLLTLAGRIPQDALRENIVKSAEVFIEEGVYPNFIVKEEYSFKMDNWSESLILLHSYYLDMETDPGSLLTCGAYREGNPIESIEKVKEDPTLPSNSERGRYWMGFRAIVRPMLTKMSINGIRQWLMMTFFVLFSAVVLLLGKRLNCATAAAFGLTVATMNPAIVSASMQYSCDFLIAFAGMLAVLLCRQRKRSTMLILFMVLGQITQYLDFYTTPVITWGLPAVVWICLEVKDGSVSGRQLLKNLLYSLAVWLLSYGAMWIVKLMLVTLFTEYDGFEAISRFLHFTGIHVTTEGKQYTAMEALEKNFTYWGTDVNRMSCLLFVIGTAVAKGIALRDQKTRTERNNGIYCLLLCCIVPVLWLAAAKQASGVHAWFQYRTVAVTIFAGLCLYANVLFPQERTTI